MKNLKEIAQWLWLILVTLFVGKYVFDKKELLVEAFRELGYGSLAISLFMILSAKIFLVVNMMASVWKVGEKLSYLQSYCIYNKTQVAKYIPGFIWHFVGRISLMKEMGIPNNRIRDSMIMEQVSVLLTAAAVGLMFVFMFTLEWIRNLYMGLIHGSGYEWYASGILLVIGIAVFVLRRRLLEMIRWIYSLFPAVTSLGSMFLVWIALGLSLWVIIQPFEASAPLTPTYVIGLYALAYVSGFVTPFAPAGIGVREMILVLGTDGILPTDTAIMLAGVNRLLYTVVEVLVLIPCMRKNV